MHILVTGAGGFVGRALVARLLDQGHTLTCLSRAGNLNLPITVQQYPYELTSEAKLEDVIFEDVDVVVHLAAKVHDLSPSQNQDEYFRANLNGTEKLLTACRSHRVKRFIFLSSVKVYGDGEFHQVTEHTQTNPEDPYGDSKLQSEYLIQRHSSEHDMEYVILRPPLVFGPGVKANFLRLMTWVNKGIPLPFKSIQNQRSLIFVENLCDLISECVIDFRAANKTFVVKDSDVSIGTLIEAIAESLGKTSHMLPFPIFLLKLFARFSGKQKEISRLIGDASVDSQYLKDTLDWQPPYSFKKSMQLTADWFQRKE